MENQWALRWVTTSRFVLMERVCFPGTNEKVNGEESYWKDVASFDNYNDAERLVRLLRSAS